jgi:hypothetical protein
MLAIKQAAIVVYVFCGGVCEQDGKAKNELGTQNYHPLNTGPSMHTALLESAGPVKIHAFSTWN